MSQLLFHRFVRFTSLVATRRRRCLLRSAWVSSYAQWLRFVIWDPGWEDPGFPHCALVLPSPPCMAFFVLVFLVYVSCVFAGHTRRWHTRCHRTHNRQELIAVPRFDCFVCLCFLLGLLFLGCFVACLRRSHWNGCVKVASCFGCMRNVFCSWILYIVLDWLHEGCEMDFFSRFSPFWR